MVECRSKLCAPGGLVLPWPSIDQVERSARKNPPRDVQRGECLFGGMLAPQKGKCGRVQRLDPDGDPVHPGAAEVRKSRRFYARRIGLEGYLQIRQRVESKGCIINQRCNRV